MEFKFVSNQKPGKVNVTSLSRQKLVRRIDQQIRFLGTSGTCFRCMFVDRIET